MSIDDAWSDAVSYHDTPVAARHVDPAPPPPPPVVHGRDDGRSAPACECFDASNDLLRQLLAELQAARLESAKRCQVYLVIVGILFAVLILYIDRLHHRVLALDRSHAQPAVAQLPPLGPPYPSPTVGRAGMPW